jgi:hypothetical protein
MNGELLISNEHSHGVLETFRPCVLGDRSVAPSTYSQSYLEPGVPRTEPDTSNTRLESPREFWSLFSRGARVPVLVTFGHYTDMNA